MVLIKFLGWVLLIWSHMLMYCILCHYNYVFMYSRLCAWLNSVSTIVWIGFLPMMQFIFACNMFMHYHALHLFILSFLSIFFSSTRFLFSSLLFLVFYLWHPRNLFLSRTQSHVVVLLLLLLPLFLIPLCSVMRSPKNTSMRTLLTGQFIRNARSFFLIFQTFLFPMRLALGVALLYVRYPRGVLMC